MATARGDVTDDDRPAEPGLRTAGRVALTLGMLARGRTVVGRFFDQRGNANKRVTLGLGLVVGTLCLVGLPELFRSFQIGNDVEIPLRAASHWSSGGQAYPASAMLVQRGPDLPYLYPPFLLPLLAPLAALPRDIVTGLWLGVCVACAAWTCRRLTIPWLAIPFVLAWPPFAEGLIVGNVQIFSFAAFVALFYEPADGALRQRALLPGRDLPNGVLAAAVGVFKITQALPVLYLASRRFRAAVIGVVAVAVAAVVMLPFTGVAIYGDWLAQLQRAANPSWTIGGVDLGRLFGIPDYALTVLALVLALSIRGRESAAWLGVALAIASPTVHGYAFLFLLPGLLLMRRDLAICVAVLFLGVYHGYSWSLGCMFVAYFLAAGTRWPSIRSVHVAAEVPRTQGLDPSVEPLSGR